MKTMKTKRFFAVLLAGVLLMLTWTGCTSSGSASALRTGPADGLTWGMTYDDVVKKLDKAGIPEADVLQESSDSTCKMMRLEPAELSKLGITKIYGLPVEEKGGGLHLRFAIDRSGTARLTSAVVSVRADAEALQTGLNAASAEALYAERGAEGTIWLGVPAKETVSEKALAKLSEEQKAAYDKLPEEERYTIYPYMYAVADAVDGAYRVSMWADYYVYMTYGNY